MSSLRVSDFTTLPGPRYIVEGPFSGELFRDQRLDPAFRVAFEHQIKLEVNLDGMQFGYPASFLEESFGGLTRAWTKVGHQPASISEEEVWDRLVIVSNDQPSLIERVRRYVLDANKRKRRQVN